MSRRRPPVLVLPGMGGGDGSTSVIRAALASQGHRVHRWNLGTNRPSDALSKRLRRRFDELSERHDEPLALVGWSLGGLYSHRLARRAPERVHSVVSLGSPLRFDTDPPALPVPTTSIYSKNDRVVPWHRSLVDTSAPRHENIEVRSTHLTLGVDPAVLFAVCDRVGQAPDDWRDFRPPLFLRGLFV